MSSIAVAARPTIELRATRSEDRRRDRECGRKVAFQSEMLARNAATLHEWDGRPGMSAYPCSWCGDWHVGHTPGSGPRPTGRRFRRRRRHGAKDATL